MNRSLREVICMKFTFLILLSVSIFGLATETLRADEAPLSEETIRAAVQRIDGMVAKVCEEHGVALNPAIDDETFVRRAYLDLAGRVPSIGEARDFLGSDYPAKRDRLIEALVNSEGHVSHAYNYWADVLRVNDQLGNNSRSNEAAYRLWIKDALRRNKGYDEMVHELVTATGHLWENGAIGYYQRDRGMPLDNMANTVRVFLGTRLECAQCHNHPFDKWTQMDFYAMAAYTNGMDGNRYDSPNRRALTEASKGDGGDARRKLMAEIRARLEEQYGKDKQAMRAAMKEELTKLRKDGDTDAKRNGGDESLRLVLNELYKPLRYTTVAEGDKPLKLPHDYQYDDAKPGDVVAAGTMFGAEAETGGDRSKAGAYAAWMTSPENPTFTKVIVNRLWKRMFGLALIEPFDDLTDQSVSTNPELLAYLEGLMKDLDYDMRAFTRILASTDSYQRAATTTELELGAPYYFQGPVLRRLTAEQVWDSALTLLVEDPDRYKPSVNGEIALIEEQKQIFESLEGLPFEDYRTMVEALSATIGEQSEWIEQKRKEAVAARSAGDEEKARALSAEVRDAQKILDRTMREQAFGKVNRGGDVAELREVFGITAEVLAESTLEAARLETPEEAVPGGLTKKERRALAKSKTEEKAKRKGKGAKGEAKPGETGILARASEITARPGSFLRTFGQSDREVIENASDEPTVPQALELLNGPVTAAVSSPGSVLGKALGEAATPEAKIETLYTAVLSRRPDAAETARLLEVVAEKGEEAYDEIAWALLNGAQFLFVQ